MAASGLQQPMAPMEAHGTVALPPTSLAMRPGGRGSGGGGEARELLVMQAGVSARPTFTQFTVVPPGTEPPPSQEARGGEQKLRQQLITLSMCVAGYLVFSKLLNYVVTLYLVDDMVATVHAVLHEMPDNPKFGFQVFAGLPKTWVQISASLLLPLCGYCGAKQQNSCLVGTFSCCSGLSCCCGSFALVLLLLLLAGMGGFAPQAEAWMVKCDPYVCSPDVNRTRHRHVVDCLAAGTWGAQYARSFPGEPKYPSVCAKAVAWLDCDGKMEGPASGPFVPERVTTERAVRMRPGRLDDSEGTTGQEREAKLLERWQRARQQAAGMEVVNSRRLLDLRGSHFASAATRWHHEPQDAALTSAEWRLAHNGPPRMPMPADVLRDCQPKTKKMHTYHAASLVVPDVVPKVVLLLAVQALLVVPAIGLGCLSMVWGLQLHGLTQRRYGQPQLLYPPGIAMQPALGTMLQSAGGASDATMEEPLMPSPGPGS